MAVNWRERITVDPKVLVGKPIIKGTRLAVEFLIDLLAGGVDPGASSKLSAHRSGRHSSLFGDAAELLHTERIVPLQPA
jgi:hypothetical protein